MFERRKLKSILHENKLNQSWQFMAAKASLNTSRRILQRSIMVEKRVDYLLSNNKQLAKRVSALQSQLSQITLELNAEKEKSFQLNLQLIQMKASSFKNNLLSLNEVHTNMERNILDARRLLSLLLAERNNFINVVDVQSLATEVENDIHMNSNNVALSIESPDALRNSNSPFLSKSVEMSYGNIPSTDLPGFQNDKHPSNEFAFTLPRGPKTKPVSPSCVHIDSNSDYLGVRNASKCDSSSSIDNLQLLHETTSHATECSKKISSYVRSPIKIIPPSSIEDTCKVNSVAIPITRESPQKCYPAEPVCPEKLSNEPAKSVAVESVSDDNDSDEFPRKTRPRLIPLRESFSDHAISSTNSPAVDDQERKVKKMRRVKFEDSFDDGDDSNGENIKPKESEHVTNEKCNKVTARKVHKKKKKRILEDSVFIPISNRSHISKAEPQEREVDSKEMANDAPVLVERKVHKKKRMRIIEDSVFIPISDTSQISRALLPASKADVSLSFLKTEVADDFPVMSEISNSNRLRRQNTPVSYAMPNLKQKIRRGDAVVWKDL